VTTKRKKKGIVVTVARWEEIDRYATMRISDDSPIGVCFKWLRRAGLKPLKPGESRNVRIIVEDE
jgi:hypothetical protein